MGIFHFGVDIGHGPLIIIGQNHTMADQDQKRQDPKLKSDVSIYHWSTDLLSSLLMVCLSGRWQNCLSWGLIDFDNKFRSAVLNGINTNRALGLPVWPDGKATDNTWKIGSWTDLIVDAFPVCGIAAAVHCVEQNRICFNAKGRINRWRPLILLPKLISCPLPERV